MTETVLVALAVAAALLLPWTGGESVAGRLLRALLQLAASFTRWLAIV